MGAELDATEEETFAAIELALTRWEGAEISLADLYSIFWESPFTRSVVVFFGRRYATTAARLTGLSKAAVEFFFHYPDQARAHAFYKLLGEVERHSLDGYRIARGIVDRVTFAFADGQSVTGFAPVAPWYAEDRLRFSVSDAWAAAHIRSVCDTFVTLDREILAFTRALLNSLH